MRNADGTWSALVSEPIQPREVSFGELAALLYGELEVPLRAFVADPFLFVVLAWLVHATHMMIALIDVVVVISGKLASLVESRAVIVGLVSK